MNKQKRRVLLAAAVGAAVLLLLAWDTRLQITEHVIGTDRVEKPVRLAILTDLHSCAYGDGQEELLAAVDALGPDAVLLGGDILDDRLPEANAWRTVSVLAEKYPCAYVTGNHEWWSGEAERMCTQMESLGVAVLRGESVVWTLNGQSVTICGVDDPDSGEDQLAAAAAGAGESGFTVLLAHRPEQVDSYLRYPFDLIVSGHAHGGQWRVPGLVNGLYAPHQGVFPRYAGGRYDFDGSVLLVSRGLARESTRIPRLFNRPELMLAEIVPSAEAK